jgi:hypothetical protein
LIKNDFIQLEGKTAMSAGLMKTKYELGRQYYTEALDEIHKFQIAETSINHTTFEYGYSLLNDKDKTTLLPKYLDATAIYSRLELLPRASNDQLILSEPKVSPEYLDALYNWFKSEKDVEKRLYKFHTALSAHCARYIKSDYTPIFLGWALEWIDELKDPYKKYIFIGRYITMQNGLIPYNFAVAKPKIQKISSSIERKLTAITLRDSMLGIILFKDPKSFKKMMGDGNFLLEEKDLMLGLSHCLHYRHYMYPDDDAGLSDIFADLFFRWELPEDVSEMDRRFDVVLNMSGWNDDKAWEKLSLMDSKDGQYPLKIVQMANMIRPFDPEFSQRLIDDLLEKFRQKEFSLTNPTLEKEIASSLVLGNIDWAIQFSEIINEQRGNKPPVCSWYTINSAILRSANKNKTVGPPIVEISNEMYKRIKEDLPHVEKLPKKQKDEGKMK